MADQPLGKRYFRSLTDEQLLAWRPAFGAYGPARDQNVGAANREYRRRAAKGGFANVYDWMRSVKQEQAA